MARLIGGRERRERRPQARAEHHHLDAVEFAPDVVGDDVEPAGGLRVPATVPVGDLPGIDLLQVCDHDGRCDRDTVYGEIFEHDMPDIDDPAAGLMFRWVISGCWKLIAPADAQAASELYDLESDPHEERDVAGAHAEVVAELTRKLDGWWDPGQE